MAQTRIQKAAAAKERAKTDARPRQPAAADRRSLLMKHTNKKNNRVRWNSRVAVKDGSTEALNDADTITVVNPGTGGAAKSHGRPFFGPKSNKTGNIHTIADLPVSPTSPVSPGTIPVRSTGHGSKGHTKSNVICSYTGPNQEPEPGRAPQNVKKAPSTFGPGTAQDIPIPEPSAGPQQPRSSLLLSPTSPANSATLKRPRADSSTFYEPPTKRPHVTLDAKAELRKLVMKHRALTPVEVSVLFDALKDSIRQYASTSFCHSVQKAEDWPLHELADRYLPLMRTTMYIADGSQYGWQQFFTNSESRAALAYGVISEIIRTHVFEMPSFALTQVGAKLMEDVDHQYLHYDAFTRAKHRAMTLRKYLDFNNWYPLRNRAAAELAEHIIEVLTPLLPPTVFDYDAKSRAFRLRKDEKAIRFRNGLVSRLSRQIVNACALSWSSILTGRNGSVISFATHLPKGDKWYGDMGAPQNCINPEMMYRTQRHGFPTGEVVRNAADVLKFPNGCADAHGDESKPWRPRIKMTCFPRVQMVVPHGLDQQDLARVQHEYEETGGDASTMPAVLPNGRVVWPEVPSMVRREYERSKGPWPKEAGEMRMGYVDLYQHLTPHDVYLEHNFMQDNEDEYVRKCRAEHTRRVEARSYRLNGGGGGDDDDDEDSADDSDTSSVSSFSSDRAREDHRDKVQEAKDNLDAAKKKLGTSHNHPLRASDRITLEQAVAQARTKHASRSVTGRLTLAVHDQVQDIWNKLIAPHGTRIENLGVVFAITALICWYKGYTRLPEWVVNGVQNARNVTLDDVKSTLNETWYKVSDSVDAGRDTAQSLWSQGSARLQTLLPAQNLIQTKTMIDSQGQVVTQAAGIGPSATVNGWAAPTWFASQCSWASAAAAGMFGTRAASGIGAGAGGGVSSSSLSSTATPAVSVETLMDPLTTAEVTETSTSTSTITKVSTVSTQPLVGIVPGKGQDQKVNGSRS